MSPDGTHSQPKGSYSCLTNTYRKDGLVLRDIMTHGVISKVLLLDGIAKDI